MMPMQRKATLRTSLSSKNHWNKFKILLLAKAIMFPEIFALPRRSSTSTATQTDAEDVNIKHADLKITDHIHRSADGGLAML